MPKPLPSPELLRKLLRYEPETGKLFWHVRTPELAGGMDSRILKSWNSRFSGKEAFTADSGKGYKCGQIYCILHFAHRLAWTIYYGVEPVGDIDHINGDRHDNAISNLRDVSRTDNLRNAQLRCDNTSGTVGVYWSKEKRKWKAMIHSDGKANHIGYFHAKTDAIAARKAAEIKYGFHPNHGRSI